MASEIAETLALEFAVRDYQWKRTNGEFFVPTADDFDEVLAKMKETLTGGQYDGTLTFGRLIMQRLAGHYDVYLHVGEYND